MLLLLCCSYVDYVILVYDVLLWRFLSLLQYELLLWHTIMLLFDIVYSMLVWYYYCCYEFYYTSIIHHSIYLHTYWIAHIQILIYNPYIYPTHTYIYIIYTHTLYKSLLYSTLTNIHTNIHIYTYRMDEEKIQTDSLSRKPFVVTSRIRSKTEDIFFDPEYQFPGMGPGTGLKRLESMVGFTLFLLYFIWVLFSFYYILYGFYSVYAYNLYGF